MNELNIAAVEPISASADGQRNAYSFSCVPLGQSMNYAACLWRQGVLSAPAINTPADWAECGKAARCGSCTALVMRKEEELAGKAIYFRDRSTFRKITETVSKWLMPSRSQTPTSPVRSSPAPKLKDYSMLDAMGNAGSFADAISDAARHPASTPPKARAFTPATVVASSKGESPLQMARRLAGR